MKRLQVPKHICLWFPIYIMAIIILQSRWTVDWLNLPGVVSQVGALMLYIPFVVFILWKLVCDIKGRKITLPILTYYGFAGYYGILTVIRFLTHMEVKDSLYYTIILMGSVALFSLIYNKHICVDKDTLYGDLCWVSVALMLYMLLFVIFLKPILSYSPINEIAVGGSILLLMPAVAKKFSLSEKGSFWTTMCTLILFSFAAVVFTLKSRVTFVIFLFEVAVLVVLHLKRKRVLIHLFAALLGAVVLIAGLFVLNVGQVRYAVYRETGFASAGMLGSGDASSDDDINSPDQQEALDQINRSDSMRADLLNESLKRVKQNVLFGTGEVFYHYEVGEEVFDAPAHNFIFATLNCYGLVGLLLLMAMVVAMLRQIHFFRFKDKATLYARLLFTLALCMYFGEGMVQATVYDMLVMPVMFTVFAAFSLSLQQTDTERN